MKDYKNSYKIENGFNAWHFAANKFFNFNNKKVLDIGCGGGDFINYLKENHHCDVCGVDPTLKSVEVCKSRKIKCKQGYFPDDFRNNQLGSNYNVITSFEVIEHLYSPMDFFTLVNKLLPNRGTFIFSTPNAFNIHRIFTFIFYQHNSDRRLDPTTCDDPEHIRLYSRHSLVKALEKIGFKEVKCYGFFKLGGRIFLLKNKFLVKYFSAYLILIAKSIKLSTG